MTPAEAAWVRANAWPDWLRRSAKVAPYLTSCPCAVCGYCSAGRHGDCYLVRHAPGAVADYVRRGVPVTWMFGTDGTTTPCLAAVYEVGHLHGQWCTCHRDGHPGWEHVPDLLELLGATA